MLKHVAHRSTTNLGTGLQRGSSNRRASVPSRPFNHQPSDGTGSNESTPPTCRRSTVHSPNTSSASSPGSSRRMMSPSRNMSQKQLESNSNSPEVPRRAEPRPIPPRRVLNDPPPRLGRSMSTPAGCRYPPPGMSPVPSTPPDSPIYIANVHTTSRDPATIQEARQFDSKGVPEAPRSSTLPRRPMSRGYAPTPPLLTALSYSSLPPGGGSALSARSSSTSSLSDTIVCGAGSCGSKVGSCCLHLQRLLCSVVYILLLIISYQ